MQLIQLTYKILQSINQSICVCIQFDSRIGITESSSDLILNVQVQTLWIWWFTPPPLSRVTSRVYAEKEWHIIPTRTKPGKSDRDRETSSLVLEFYVQDDVDCCYCYHYRMINKCRASHFRVRDKVPGYISSAVIWGARTRFTWPRTSIVSLYVHDHRPTGCWWW